MASRKQEKEARRQERLQAEQSAAAEQRRKKLFTGIGAAALAAVVVVVVLIVVSQSGSDDTAAGGGDVAGAAEVEAELAGVPQSGTVLGDAEAKVSVVEFGDLQCPACKQFSEVITPELVDGVVKNGDANLEFLNFTIIGPDSTVAAKAALAASEQDRYWEYVELFYRNQGRENDGYAADDAFLTDIARGAGVPDLAAWEESRNDPKWDDRLAETQQRAASLGFQSTPSILIVGPDGEEIPLGSVGSVGDIEDAITQALQG